MPTPRTMAGRPYCWAWAGKEKTRSVGRSASAENTQVDLRHVSDSCPCDLLLGIATSFGNVGQVIVRRQSLLGDHVDGLVNRNSDRSGVLIHPGVGAENVVLQNPQILQLQKWLLFHAGLRRELRLRVSNLGRKIGVMEITEYSDREKT